MIYGTTDPHFYDSPWFVHLAIQEKNGKSNSCSGTLISPFMIITAAHCVDTAKPNGWSVFAGVTGDQHITNGVERKVKSFTIHPGYLNNGLRINPAFDLALILVETPFVVEEGKIQGVQFPTLGLFEPALLGSTISPNNEPLYPLSRWSSCQIAGSGQTLNETGTGCMQSKVRRFMSGILLAPPCCKSLTRLENGNKESYPVGTFCLFNSSDAGCVGDSGAGVTCLSSTDKTPALVGVLVAGTHCCDKKTGERFNIPLPHQIVPMDYSRRQWVHSHVNHHYSFGVLLGDPIPTPTLPTPEEEDEFSDRIKDNDYMRR